MVVRRFVCRVAGAMWVALVTTAMVGCEPSKPAAPAATAPAEHAHDHEDLAIGTFAESVGTLRKIHDEIKTACDANKPDDAHHALHDIRDVLEALGKQVATVPAEKQEAAKQAVKTLSEGYNKIDKALHDSEDIKYAEISDSLSQSMTALEAAK